MVWQGVHRFRRRVGRADGFVRVLPSGETKEEDVTWRSQ